MNNITATKISNTVSRRGVRVFGYYNPVITPI
jgi:hypothetical protein